MRAALRIAGTLALVATTWLGGTACTPVPVGTDIDGDGTPDVVDLHFGGAGCTYGMGWWKNHHAGEKHANKDIPWPIAEDTELCGQTLLDILDSPVRGDAWMQLAHHWIPATLNAAHGASVPSEVAVALSDAGALLQTCAVADGDRAAAQEMAALLESYNEGEIGPGHCDDAPDPGPLGQVECWVGDGTTTIQMGGGSGGGGPSSQDVEQVYFTIRTLGLNGQGGWLFVSDDTWQVDATAPVPEPTLLVASGEIPVGTYTEVRMELVWVNLVVNGQVVQVDPADFGGDPLVVPVVFDAMACGSTRVDMTWDLTVMLGATLDDLDIALALAGTPSYDTTGCP